MAYKTRTWDDVYSLTVARLGGNIASSSVPRLASLMNSAARFIHDETRFWGRFLVLEPRTVERGYIDYTEDSFNVYGAETANANGLYVRNGTNDSRAAYTLYDEDSTTELYNLKWRNLTTSWEILDSNDVTIYENTTDSTTPPLSGWEIHTSGNPSLTRVQALSEIDECIGYWSGARWVGNNLDDLGAYPDQNGIQLTSSPHKTVYVAFKKTLTDTYGDGTGNTVSDIPSEWADFIAYDVARAFMAGERIQDGYNPIAIRDVESRLNQALVKANRQGAFNTIQNQFKTNYGMDVSIL